MGPDLSYLAFVPALIGFFCLLGNGDPGTRGSGGVGASVGDFITEILAASGGLFTFLGAMIQSDQDQWLKYPIFLSMVAFASLGSVIAVVVKVRDEGQSPIQLIGMVLCSSGVVGLLLKILQDH